MSGTAAAPPPQSGGLEVFARILHLVVRQTPGALGAVFIDWEGEAITDHCRSRRRTDMRLLGAHWAVIYFLVRNHLASLRAQGVERLVLRLEHLLVVVAKVTTDYLLVVALRPEGNLARALSACDVAVERLRREM